MRLRQRLYVFGLFAALMLAVAGCPGGGNNNPPNDGGTDGDGGDVECTSAAQCDDANVCTDDTCVDGACVHTNNSVACDDGQACSENDVCSDGVCSGTAVGCDDGNPCTNDSCDANGCVYIPNSAPCDDNDACTLGDVCSNGTCAGGTVVDCDDGNLCTDDVCDPAVGCRHTPNDAACDDGQACSSNDHCSNGVCVGDSNVDCDDNNPCTEDRCDDSLGCVYSYNVAPCDDGSECTESDACNQGVCTGLPVDCNDGNLCTTDSCDPATGCLNENNTDPCNDGDDCTVGDVCSNGACVSGGARDCNDNNICTDDSCVQGLGCTHANNNAACDDGDACTDGDICMNGSCQGGGSPFDCDDGNPCTDDQCHPVNGCSHSYNTDACDDADACTINDVCSNGTCAGVAKDTDGDSFIDEACGGQDCNDDNANINPGVFEGPSGDAVCSDGVDNNCNDLTDIEEASCGSCNNNGDCDDNNVCNGTETCSGGTCQAGTPLTCNDNEPCTTDNCDPAAGCQYVNNTLPCDDGNACTTGDICGGGSCQAGGGTLDCNDSDPCTDDSCNPASGCEYSNNTAPCDDGDDCTTGDTCSGGVCQPGAGGPDCDDGNDCTADSCIDGTGCVHNPLDDGTGCNDGSQCTTNDQCSNGTCTGSSVNCNDNNVCTSDSCDDALGCVYNPTPGSCNDGDACTVNDQCSAGNCTGTIRDLDSDGYGDGETCAGDDCDDGDPNINPGMPEACGDGVDNNCNDVIDEGCSGCDTVVAAGLLQIDNDVGYSSYALVAGDEALNAFFVEAPSYNAIEIDAYFADFSGGSGNAQGNYSVHVYADDAGLPGAELASSGSELVNEAPDVAHTFSLSAPVGFTQGQLFWVAVRSESDQSTNLFLPLIDGGIGVPYQGGALYSQTDDDYYGVMGNWLIRVQGCGEGPWLELADHSESAQVLPAGGSVTSTASLHNRGFAGANGVSGVMSIAAPEIVLTSDTADFGNISQGATATGAPAYGISADAMAYGIYGMLIEASDGPNSWSDAYGVYVQGSGCASENHTLLTDNDTPTYIIQPAAGDEIGNYFVVDSTSFAMTSAEVQFYNTEGDGPFNFRLKVYTYRGGYPDKVIYQSGWQSVSANNVTPITFSLPTALTFKQGDTFFVVVESQSDTSSTNDFSVLFDDGDTQTGSWMNGYMWDDATGAWGVVYLSAMIRVNGCQSTELVYESHTSNPDPIQKGASATLNITVRNIGAEDASNVSGTLTSPTGDITVTQGTRSYGTIAAGATGTANGFQINVAAGAPDFQYLLDLELTDGTNTWNEVVPIQLAGGNKNLAVQNFTATLVGNDIQYHWDVVNTGNVDVVNTFDVDLYIDRASAPGIGDAGDWTDSPASLAVGQSLPYDLVLPDAPTGSYDAWVQVDTGGAISESNEGDNVAGPETVDVGATDVFELLDPARKWFPADMPVDFRFVTGNTQGGLSQSSARDAVRVGFAQWAGSGASISFNEAGDASAGQGGYVQDGISTMTFDDPYGEVPAGALAATLPIYNGQTMVTNGVTFYRMTDADIVFNDNINFVRNGAACNNGYDIDGVATHEQGHLVGLDHTEVFDATMYYAIGPCDMGQVSLEQSDINGVTFIYP